MSVQVGCLHFPQQRVFRQARITKARAFSDPRVNVIIQNPEPFQYTRRERTSTITSDANRNLVHFVVIRYLVVLYEGTMP